MNIDQIALLVADFPSMKLLKILLDYYTKTLWKTGAFLTPMMRTIPQLSSRFQQRRRCIGSDSISQRRRVSQEGDH